MQNSKVAVIGSGSWASAIVKILLNNINKVNWYIREPEIIKNLKEYGHNPFYLSSVNFNMSKLELFNNPERAIENSNYIIFCVPSAYLHNTIKHLNSADLEDKIIISAIKGIIPEYNTVITEYFNKNFNVPYNNYAVISGPSHAEEVARERLTYLTISSVNNVIAKEVSELISGRFIYTTISSDIYGTEYAPVLKNIMALASGICHSLGYGDNFQAVLISSAIKEIRIFLNKVHPFERDINNSVYLGDLLVTAYSQYSRNRMFGAMIGKGYSVKATQMEMKMVAEGYYAAKCIKEINNKYHVKMPIVDAVYSILYDNSPPEKEIKSLAKKLS